MIKDLYCGKTVKKRLENELANPKKSATYMIYGNDRELLFSVALAFGKALNCKNSENDFCDECESCKRMNSKTHGDLEIIHEANGIKIEAVREIKGKMAKSSYEGGNKIFILEDVNRMKPAAANALLKVIEEPEDGNYFFLLTTSMSILPTIKSRSSLIKIDGMTAEELGVSKEVYNFFNRNITDISNYKKGSYDLESAVSYLQIGEFLKKYFKDKADGADVHIELENKINIYKAIREYVKNIKWASELDKILFVEEIEKNLNEREFVFEILAYIAGLNSKYFSMEKLLLEKNKLRLPLNIKASLLKVL